MKGNLDSLTLCLFDSFFRPQPYPRYRSETALKSRWKH